MSEQKPNIFKVLFARVHSILDRQKASLISVKRNIEQLNLPPEKRAICQGCTLPAENQKLKEEIRRYGETALIFKRVSDLYYNSSEPCFKEPVASAVKLLIKQGEEAIKLQQARNREEYIEKLQKRIELLTKALRKYREADGYAECILEADQSAT